MFFTNVKTHRKNGQGEEHCATQSNASSQCVSSNVDLESFIARITTVDFASRVVVLSFIREICEKNNLILHLLDAKVGLLEVGMREWKEKKE